MRLALLVLLAALLMIPAPGRAADYQLESAFPYIGFQFPTDIQSPPDGTNRIVLVQKNGIIRVFPKNLTTQPSEVTTFLDLSSKVFSSSEAGCLGIAFHPDYAQNGFFYVYYVTPDPYHAILARYHVSSDPNVADPLSETILLDQPKITPYHNGGQLAFGTDGYLYLSMGEDLQFDPAQDLTNLFGSILRIDVDSAFPYAIPPDNPFAGNSQGYREEIWAYGFRNPWRFSIDEPTGRMWVGDVGENTWEEVDTVVAGGNYGWPYVEGPVCLDTLQCQTLGSSLLAPVYVYDHDEGRAVIGGEQYRGTRLPELDGVYVYADYTAGKIWGLTFDGMGNAVRTVLVEDAPTILTFGYGPNHELYVIAAAGYIYQLGRLVTDAAAPAAVASRLFGNYPNPFNPSTTIRYQLASPAHVAIDVVSVNGALVRTLDAGARPAGAHDLIWRGDTANGDIAASGVYFYRLRVDGAVVDTRRMVLLK